MNSQIPPDSASPPTWDRVERVLEDLSKLAASDVDPDNFHQQLLAATAQMLEAAGGGLWLFDDQGQLQLQHALNFEQLALSDSGHQLHDALLVSALKNREPLSAPKPSDSSNASPNGLKNPTDKLLVMCPMVLDETPIGVIEVFCDRDATPSTRTGMEQLLVAVAEQAAEYERHVQVLKLQQQVQAASEMPQVIDRIHQQLDLQGVGYGMANELRHWLGCDRVTVLSRHAHQRRAAVLAVSGVERVNRRAETVSALESAAQPVLNTGESVWYGNGTGAAFPALEEYVDLAHPTRVGILPLTHLGDPSDEREPTICGAIILEQTEAPWPALLRERAHALAPHCGTALYNAQQHDGLPLLFLSRWLQRAGWLFGPDGRPAAIAILLVIAGIFGAGLLIPAELQVAARGRVQPSARARVFAPYDADVLSIETMDGDPVNEGELLISLRSLPLEIERDQVEAKLETAKARLDVIDIELVSDRDTPDPEAWRARLSAERKEVELLTKIHQQRIEEIDDQMELLQVVSPIDGVVLSWMLKDLLADRPVSRGQHLLTVGKVDGEWVLELDVADYHIQHLHRAREADPNLEVRFMMESVAGRTMTGKLKSLAPSATTTDSGRSVIKAEVSVDNPPANLRPGAMAVARIQCGRTNLAYSLFHDLIDAVRSWLWV